jgi:hypothetical protein
MLTMWANPVCPVDSFGDGFSSLSFCLGAESCAKWEGKTLWQPRAYITLEALAQAAS